jgi:predicted HicB family RNase H-like nuclease
MTEKAFLVRMPGYLHDALQASAERHTTSASELIRRLIIQWLADEVQKDDDKNQGV